MKTFILFFATILLAVSTYAQDNSVTFYVGTYTSTGADGIYLCSLNLQTGELTQLKSFSGIENPSFVRLSPDKKNLYAVSEADEKGSFVYAYKVDNKGNLSFLNRQSSNGNGPCHVDVSRDGKYVATATYGGGTTSLYATQENGALNKANSIFKNEGKSKSEQRQSRPHAHSINFSLHNNLIFSADLGTDQVDIYELVDGKMKKYSTPFVKMEAGAGPRHIAMHPKYEQLYVINELNSTVSVVRQSYGQWKTIQNISTLPGDFNGTSYCADIHVSKDGNYVYASNRGHNSIAIFRESKMERKLKLKGTVSVEGDWPRNFGISPDGNWMLVANQKSNDITVFKINKQSGMPQFSGNKLNLPSPVCIEFL